MSFNHLLGQNRKDWIDKTPEWDLNRQAESASGNGADRLLSEDLDLEPEVIGSRK